MIYSVQQLYCQLEDLCWKVSVFFIFIVHLVVAYVRPVENYYMLGKTSCNLGGNSFSFLVLVKQFTDIPINRCLFKEKNETS